MNRSYVSDIVVALIAVLVGAGVGYWYGNLSGVQVGIQQQKNIESLAKKAQEQQTTAGVNPFGNTTVNPFKNSTVNPYSNIKTNPFQ